MKVSVTFIKGPGKLFDPLIVITMKHTPDTFTICKGPWCSKLIWMYDVAIG